MEKSNNSSKSKMPYSKNYLSNKNPKATETIKDKTLTQEEIQFELDDVTKDMK